MSRFVSDIAFTDTVKAVQDEKGSREIYRRVEEGRGWQSSVTPQLEAFLAGLDMFYLATANADGQPYIQYRGGPRGFLRAVDDKTLAFADFAGNRQSLSLGNLRDNDRSFLFLIDYERRQRVKVWGRARVVEDDPNLLAKLADPSYEGVPERVVLFGIEAWDINCPQHIHERVPRAKVDATVAELQARIADLEAQLEAKRGPGAAAVEGA